jgi:plasmid stabilization system protein ParE
VTLRWTPKTQRQLTVIHDSIAKHNPKAAAQTIESLLEGAEQLLLFPNLGRPGKRKSTRELVRASITIVYRSLDDVVSIEAVFRDNLQY